MLKLLDHFESLYFSPTSNFTIILGNFTKEDLALAPKLLLLRPTGMLCNISKYCSKADRDNYAEEIYNILRCYAGCRGFEVRRTCGSSGLVNHKSDKDLLKFLSYHEGILPRKAHGCLIVRGVDKYHFCYARPKFVKNQLKHVCFDYTPPREGGQFEMPDVCIAQYPPVAEMIYLKSMSVSVLKHLNNLRYENGLYTIASGPLQYEYSSLLKAREAYEKAPEGNKMFHFLSKFNSFNKFSMVAYPVGMHYDYFKEGKESLENRILFCTKPKKNSVGRGGSIVGSYYVYALLDW